MEYEYNFDLDIENETVVIHYAVNEDSELSLIDIKDFNNRPIETTIFSEDFFEKKAWDNYLNHHKYSYDEDCLEDL